MCKVTWLDMFNELNWSEKNRAPAANVFCLQEMIKVQREINLLCSELQKRQDGLAWIPKDVPQIEKPPLGPRPVFEEELTDEDLEKCPTTVLRDGTWYVRNGRVLARKVDSKLDDLGFEKWVWVLDEKRTFVRIPHFVVVNPQPPPVSGPWDEAPKERIVLDSAIEELEWTGKKNTPKNNDGHSVCQFGCGVATVKHEGFSGWYDVCPKCGK